MSSTFCRRLAVLLLAWMMAGAALAQAPEPAGARAVLEQARARLEQTDATLKRSDLSDEALSQVRAALDPLLSLLERVVEETAPRVETLKARLAQLGPRPDAKGPPESPEAARDRAERERALKEAEETLQLTRAMLLETQQTITDITDRRRSRFARLLFERSTSPLNPALWWQAAQGLPRDLSALGLTLSDWGRVITDARADARWLLALVGLFAAFLVLGPLTRFVERYAMRNDASATPQLGQKAFRAGVVALLGALRPLVAAFCVYWGLDSAALLPGRVAPVALMALAGMAIVAAVRAIAQGILAPDAPNWRLQNISDQNAAALKASLVQASAVHMTGKTIETINQAIGAGLPLTIVTRSLFAVLFVAVLWKALSASRPADPSEEACLGPYVPPPVTLAGPIRLALAAALIAILIATATGFVALATFLIDQVMWVGVIGAALLLLALILVEEIMTSILAPNSRASRVLSESVGLRRQSIEQMAVIATGLLKILLSFAAVLLIIAPWGVESGDLLLSLRSALFGFKIGDVTISFSAILAALVVFGLGFLLTRTLQRWLDEKFLPRTDLDAGIRNSVVTAVGYAGVVLAGALSVSSLGLSLDRVAIIAGALSVGIGFGLQSIVNNFVSGLILLWERPIRVGDLIVVGDDQGYVRRINVRSTEVETFDRSTVIMPNSNLVSGVVKNRMHTDRTGRILIPLSAPRAFDPEAVSRILTDAANAHPDVMKKPPPRVLFKKIGDAQLDFELICYVADVELLANVSSDLHFAIFREVIAAQPAAATPKMNVEGLSGVEGALGQIAQAIEQRGDANARDAAAKAGAAKRD